MKIKIYVNWDDEKVLSEKEAAKQLVEDKNIFNEWLIDRYTPEELLKMKDNEQEKVRQKYKEYCETTIKDMDYYDVHEIEI